MWLRKVGVTALGSTAPAVRAGTTFLTAAYTSVSKLQNKVFCYVSGLRNFTGTIPAIRNRRSKHSSEWIKRQITDRYVQLAQEVRLECFASRPHSMALFLHTF